MTAGAPPGPPLPDFAAGPAGLGERFEVEPSTGTASLAVPLPFATDRTGLAPPLSLVHGGGGNGPFGLGWALTVPSVTRVGDEGVPRYDETDRFSITGLGEVGPALEWTGGEWVAVTRDVGTTRIAEYRPVVGFDTHVVERWTDRPSGVSRWRVVDPDGRVSIFGETAEARTADPASPARIHTWFLERSWDATGNAFRYLYKREDYAGVPATLAAEALRMARGAPAGSYLKRVFYANRVPFDPADPDADPDYRLEAVLDYGEHDTGAPETAADETAAWVLRADPHSRYPGFEIRQYRRCRALLLFNRYPALSAAERLTDIVAFDYGADEAARAGSRLRTVTWTGRRGDIAGGWTRSAPPLSFRYTEPGAAGALRTLLAEDGQPFASPTPPSWTDLYGEGVSHALYRRAGGWAMRRNLGSGRFGPEERIGDLPSATLAGRGILGDVETDGARDFVVSSPATAGFHRLDPAERTWDRMQDFEQVARTGTLAPGLLDCSGNGQTDLLFGGHDDVVWIESDGRSGDRMPLRRASTEDGPPGLAPAPGRGLFAVDLTGSGLADIVKLENASLRVWPNLGHGHFGPGVPLAGAPRFDHDDAYDPLRVRFADVTGSGVPDLIYLGTEATEIWENLAGNGFRKGETLPPMPMPHGSIGPELVDLLADGTLCLVTTSSLPGDEGAPVRYLPLAPGGPPGRLAGYSNGTGGEVRIAYSSSAAMYLDATAAGDPWPLPLASHPVVVTAIERIDHVTGSLTVERFRYHDAVSDPETGGLATFGMTERSDFDVPAAAAAGAGEIEAATVRTWFHAGEREGEPALALRRARQVFAGDGEARALRPSAAVAGPWPEAAGEVPTARMARRALCGRGIRQEVFAGDEAAAPYQVTESRFRATPRQTARQTGAERRGATAVYPVETLVHLYEGAAGDARIEHTLHLAADRFGRTTRIAEVAYGRRGGREVHPDQAVTLVSVEETDTADLAGAPAATLHAFSGRAIGTLLERRRFELLRVGLDDDGYLTPETLGAQITAALVAPLDFGADIAHAPPGPVARRVEWERRRYLDAAGAPTANPAAIALPVRIDGALTAAFPAVLIAGVLPGGIDAAELQRLGYVAQDSYWWRPGPRHGYRPAAEFRLLETMTDTFGTVETLDYDAEHRMLTATTDGLGLETRVAPDYLALQPMRRTDPNGVVAEVRFDPLRRVRARSVRGNTAQPGGGVALAGDEPLDAHDPRPAATLADALGDPAAFVQGAAAAAYYDDLAWHRHVAAGGDPATAPPAAIAVLTRTRHLRDDAGAPVDLTVSHYSGAGVPAQSKRRVDSGPAFRIGAGGAAEVSDTADRWRVAGRQVPNAKGLVLVQYADIHAEGAGFDPVALFEAAGRALRMRYDPMGRISGTLSEAGYVTEVWRTPWTVVSFDENDSIERSPMFTERIPAGEIADVPTLAAVEAARAHADTPATAHLDARGRPFLMETLLAAGGAPLQTHQRYDAQGRAVSLTDPRQVAANAARAPGAQVECVHYLRDMQGLPLVETSADGGTQRTLTDAVQNVAHVWDAAGNHILNTRDAAGRVTRVDGAAPGDAAMRTLEIHRFEPVGAGAAANRNAIGRIVEIFDQAGRREILRYDHEGRPLETIRQFAEEYRAPLDWGAAGPAAPALLPELFRTEAEHDALGRQIRQRRADGSLQTTTYSRGGAVTGVRIEAANGAVDETFLAGVDHDAFGDRVEERHGNGTRALYGYDAETGRLFHQETRRGGQLLADLDYAHDPVGNLTYRMNRTREHIVSNLPAVPAADRADRFAYDALYRLTTATGRVHMGFGPTGSQGRSPGLIGGAHHISLNDGNMLRTYRRSYEWDGSGNLTEMRHVSAAGNFTRTMWVDDVSNRSITRDGPGGLPRPGPATLFDAAGRLTRMDHLEALTWSVFGQLASAVVIGRPGGIDDAEYYVYGADGQRVRKVEERLDTGQRLVIETLYLGGCTITRRRRGANPEFERRSGEALIGGRRLGVVHHWTLDSRALEVDAAGTTAVRYMIAITGGHTQLVVDGTGAVVSYEEYAPFGETTFVAGDNVRELTSRRLRFAGKERDDVTGFIAFPFRYYLPWLTRWLTPDPMGIVDGMNLYAYVHGNPLTFRDDLGLETEEERRRREWQTLMAGAVAFESLPENVQAQARSGWLTASERGAQVYLYDPSHSLYEFNDATEANRAVSEGRAIAIRTINPGAAAVRRMFDELDLEGQMAEITALAAESPYTLDPETSPAPAPPAETPVTPAAPGGGSSPGGSGGQQSPAGTPPAAGAGGDEGGTGPDIPPVSLSAAARAARSLPGSPQVGAPVDRVPTELPDEALRWGDSDDARRALLSRPEFQNGRVPREFGLDGLGEIAPERLEALNQHAAAAGRTPLEVAPLPEGVNPGQIDPHGPTNGQYGHVGIYDDMTSAETGRHADYLDQDNPRRSQILTEREHGAARGQLAELGRRPDGTTQYTHGSSSSHYNNDVAVWNTREGALDKTHGNRGGPGADNPVTSRMQAQTRAGGAHDFGDVFVDARENFQRSLRATNSPVPPRSADIGVYHQMTQYSGITPPDEVADFMAGAADEDWARIESAFDTPDSHSWAGFDAPHVPDVPNPGRGARALGALKSGGKVALEVLGPVGTGLSLYSFATARTTEDRILTGADLGADLIGYAGPVGATFSISYGVTRAVDEGIGWASKEYLGRDLAPSSVMADGMLEVDQALTSLWADPSRPAYTQTIGWKLAEFFDSL